MTLPSGTRLGPYEIVALPGAGGTGLVYFSLTQYYSGSGPVYAVDVETGGTFRAGVPRLLFPPPRELSGLAATADLSHFLVTVPAEGTDPASITMTLSWQARSGGCPFAARSTA